MNKNKNLIYIYNPYQAEFIIKYTKSEGLYRIGKGSEGDVCVSFRDIPVVRKAMEVWVEYGKGLSK